MSFKAPDRAPFRTAANFSATHFPSFQELNVDLEPAVTTEDGRSYRTGTS
jgi:hypothetical protein